VGVIRAQTPLSEVIVAGDLAPGVGLGDLRKDFRRKRGIALKSKPVDE